MALTVIIVIVFWMQIPMKTTRHSVGHVLSSEGLCGGACRRLVRALVESLAGNSKIPTTDHF